jgi:hypothetical protein
MSDTAQDSSEPKWPAKDETGGGTRKVILYGLLALMVAALAYDFLVARPAVNAAYDKIAAASVEINAKGNEYLSNTDVQELIGKKPAETFMDGTQSVEVFKWTGGLIVKPHRLYAVYRKNGDDWMFSRHEAFAYDESGSTGAKGNYVVEVGDVGEEDDYESESMGISPPAARAETPAETETEQPEREAASE